MNVTRGIESLEGLRGKVQQCVHAKSLFWAEGPLEDSVSMSYYQLEAPGITGLQKAAHSCAEILVQKAGSHDPSSRIPGLKFRIQFQAS